MAEDNINIQMRLVSVGEVSFMMSPGKVGDDVSPDSMKIGFSTQIQPDVQNDIFVLLFGTRYELNGEVVLESIYKFVALIHFKCQTKGIKTYIMKEV